MNKLFTKIGTAMVGIAMAIGVGVAVGRDGVKEVRAEENILASWSVSNGSTVTSTSGLTENNNLKSGGSGKSYKQDNSTDQEYYASLKTNSASYFAEASSRKLTFKAKIGGGTAKTLSSSIYVAYLNSSGNVIDASIKTVTGTITTADGDDYSILMDVSATTVYGVKIYHDKTASYNVRFYSFSLSYDTTPSISIDQADQTINVGDDDVELTATTNNSGGATVVWTSSNTDAATISSSGVVHAVSSGKTTITAKITVNLVDYSDTIEITVINTVARRFVKITSESELVDGNYVIVYETGNLIFDGSLDALDVSSNTQTISIENSKIRAYQDYSFTITKVSTSWNIKSANDKYIGRSSDSNGMDVSDSALANTISFDGGNVNIVGAGGAYLRYNSDSGQERFRYFKTSSYTSQKAICLYREMTADDYAKSFLTAGLNTIKQNCSATKTAWTSLEQEFDDLNDTVKQTLREATHDASTTYDDSTNLSVAHCVARYDQVIIANGIENYPDFMGRTTQGTLVLLPNNSLINSVNNNSGFIAIIAVATAISAFAVAGLLISKKRKED